MSNKEGVGIVSFHDYTLPNEEAIILDCGKNLLKPTIRYEQYGELNSSKSNAILIIHALTGNHHAAGRHKLSDKKPGWWDALIGPGRAFDTNKYFVICTNNLGGCSGTTGPNSINPETGKPYGLEFPMITIPDMVKLQVKLMDFLGIPRFFCIAGGSMGGMLAIHWSVAYPDRVANVVCIAATAAQSAQSIAFSQVGRQAIIRDPQWNGGNYFLPEHNSGRRVEDENISEHISSNGPKSGLAVARMLAHITYLSDESMRHKFGRELQNSNNLKFTFEPEFKVESYLRHQGDSFFDRFDANSYLYITKALNYFDMKREFGSLEKAFAKAKASFLVLCFSTDWLYPSYMSRELARAMFAVGNHVSYSEIKTDLGHDAFLLEWKILTQLIGSFLNGKKL